MDLVIADARLAGSLLISSQANEGIFLNGGQLHILRSDILRLWCIYLNTDL